jgi:hypothetical protein
MVNKEQIYHHQTFRRTDLSVRLTEFKSLSLEKWRRMGDSMMPFFSTL